MPGELWAVVVDYLPEYVGAMALLAWAICLLSGRREDGRAPFWGVYAVVLMLFPAFCLLACLAVLFGALLSGRRARYRQSAEFRRYW